MERKMSEDQFISRELFEQHVKELHKIRRELASIDDKLCAKINSMNVVVYGEYEGCPSRLKLGETGGVEFNPSTYARV